MFKIKADLEKLMNLFVQKKYVPATAGAPVFSMGGCMDCSNSCAENCAAKCKAKKK